MSSRRALWVSTSMETRGGAATYVRTMQRTPLWDLWHIRHVATHRNGSVASRVTAFITGTGSFLRELAVQRLAVVHLRTASHCTGVSVVIHVHGGGFKEFHSRSPRLIQHYIRVTLEGADAVIALAEKWAGALRQLAPGARIAVVSNAVEPRTPVDQPGPGEPVHVLFLGDIEDHKGTSSSWRRVASSPAGRSPAVPIS